MNLDERNAVWNGIDRRFIQVNSRSSTPRFWEIRVIGNTVAYTWGQVGGAPQEAREHCQGVNIGKKNEISPEAYALYRAKEMIRKKVWEGYREVGGSNEFLDVAAVVEIDFDNLAMNLSFYKPDNTMGAGITKKADAGLTWYARKRNGLMYVLCKGSDTPHLYSRRMLRQHDDEENTPWTWDDRFPHIIAAADQCMPANSILLGELVMDRNGDDDFSHVQSLTKSLTPQSLQDQALSGRPNYYAWDVAFWNGQNLVKTAPVKDRYELIHEIGNQIIMPVQFYKDITTQQAIEIATNAKWEGFVVVDPEGIYGEKGYNFRGKPDRPGSVCAKLKPSFDDDFIAWWDPNKKIRDVAQVYSPKVANDPVGEVSKKGRYNGGVKSVALFQYNSSGQLVYISNVHSGLTEELKTSLSNPALFPQVWKVEYKDRRYMSQGDETNAMDFAAFLEVRTDKSPEECINPEL